MTDSSNSSKDLGNTKPSPKQCSPAKRWCFTLNNYTKEDLSSIVPVLSKYCDKYLVAKEVGESGTPHLQGFINFKTKARPKSVFCFNEKFHWEAAKGNDQQQVNYIGSELKNKSSKSEIWLSEGMPKPPTPIRINLTWNTLWTNMLEIVTADTDKDNDRLIHWLWSDRGKFGKTQFTRYLVHHHKAQFITGGKYADIMNLVYHTDMDECQILVVNVPRILANNVSYSALEAIKDGLVSNMKSHTNGSKIFNPPHVLVFANSPPKSDTMSTDKWNIYNIDFAREITTSVDTVD